MYEVGCRAAGPGEGASGVEREWSGDEAGYTKALMPVSARPISSFWIWLVPS